MSFQYPKVRRDESVIDDYHGHKIADPYRYLEDPDSEETQAFVEEQNNITMPFIQSCPLRKSLHSKIQQMWDFPKYSCPAKHGSRYFYRYNSGLQNHSVLYMQETLESEGVVYLDPNLLSEDGTVALKNTSYSEDGQYLAYTLSHAGSDWVSIKFRKIENNEELPDVLEQVKFSCMAWTHDNKGLFYGRFPTDGKSVGTETGSNLNQKLYYHRLGDKQDKDILCCEWPDHPKWMTAGEVSDCGKYLLITIHESCDPVNRLYYTYLRDLPDDVQGPLPYVKVVDNFDAEYEYITNEETLFTFKTNLNAPNYKLININLDSPQMENWTTLVEEDIHDVLEWAACVNNDKLVLCYLRDVKNVLNIHDLRTGAKISNIPLDIGSIVGYSGKKTDVEMFFTFMSFLTPSLTYRCDMTKEPLTAEVFRNTLVEGFVPQNFQTDQIFYTSKDGTKIPMFIVHRKDVAMNGRNPVMLYGYGGFNISITPVFSVSRTVFMSDLGGIVAVPNIRGGAEYGETWHKGGMLGNKQNCFDDFIAAAQYLIDNKYTNPSRIILQGGSNGGLLVAACMIQRPDLFGCIISQVGVMDMLRFHKFTIGHAWTSDYGCADVEEEFQWLIKYSPLHNVKPLPDNGVQYPAMLLLTSDHDDRVVPSHSLKFIAEVQHVIGSSSKQKRPLMIRVDTKCGHGAGKPTAKIIEEVADTYSFIALTLDLH